MDAEMREALLLCWACAAAVVAGLYFALWRQAQRFAHGYRDGWRESAEHGKAIAEHAMNALQARAGRVQAEADLVDALKQGAKPEAQA